MNIEILSPRFPWDSTVKVGFFFAKIKPKSLQSQLILETINSGFFFVRFFFREKKSMPVFVISPSVIGEISNVMLSKTYLKKVERFFHLSYYAATQLSVFCKRKFLCFVGWTYGTSSFGKPSSPVFFSFGFFFVKCGNQ